MISPNDFVCCIGATEVLQLLLLLSGKILVGCENYLILTLSDGGKQCNCTDNVSQTRFRLIVIKQII